MVSFNMIYGSMAYSVTCNAQGETSLLVRYLISETAACFISKLETAYKKLPDALLLKM